MLKYTHLLATAALSLALAAPAFAQDDATRDTVVATVDGTEITLGQMIIARSQLPQQYQQLPDEVLFQGVLDQLIQQQVLADTLETDPSRVTIALQNERRALLAGEAINSIVENAASEEAVVAAYEAAFADAEPVTEYNAAHILVATEQEAQDVVARIAAGEDFADLARELSTDPGSGAEGGVLGWFGPGMMVAPFEAAVTALEPGQMSDPVETQFGWHIVKLNEIRDQQPPALEDVRADLENQIRQTAIETTLNGLVEAADVTRPEEGAFDPTVLRNLEMLRD